MPKPPAISVIIPAYNESRRLIPTLDRVLEHPWLGEQAEIIVVDDGSTDHTFALASQCLAGHPLAKVLRLERNAGKGAAIRRGVKEATGDKVLFMDADLATSLNAVGPMIDRLEADDVVVGSRSHEDSVVTGRSRSRAVMHRAFSAPARQVTGLKVSDPQCGFKGFRADAAKELFQRSLVNGYTIDVELLMIAGRLGMSISEIPVQWRAVEGSKIRAVRDPLAMAADVAKLRYRNRQRLGGRRLDAPDAPKAAA
ncbi:MAG: glycosyltransferase family 2 protein [Solirubrobacteraceae bacterium]|nr:glycosyltransferase family 2 protein [Solirubrobacteraceae bacterium]